MFIRSLYQLSYLVTSLFKIHKEPLLSKHRLAASAIPFQELVNKLVTSVVCFFLGHFLFLSGYDLIQARKTGQI